MDISETLAPNSDQLDAIELVSGPRIFTVQSVSQGNAEQPVQVHFDDFPRPWRPSKGMRRVLAGCWGPETSEWAGRRVKLFFDPEVTFGKDKPGGTRIAALSDIDKVRRIPLLVTRGKSALFTVEPLPEVTVADLRAEWKTADPDRRKVIEAEVNRLSGTHEQGAGPSEASAPASNVDGDAGGTSSSSGADTGGPAPDGDSEAGVESRREASEPDGEPSAATSSPAAEGKPATRQQLRVIHAGLADFELDRDGADERRLWVLSTIAGRAVQAPEDLTEPEAKKVADTFEMAERSISKLREMVEAIEADAS